MCVGLTSGKIQGNNINFLLQQFDNRAIIYMSVVDFIAGGVSQ